MTSLENAIDSMVSEIKHIMFHIKDVNKTSTMELFDILEARLQKEVFALAQVDDPKFPRLTDRFNNIGRRIIPHMTGEQVGFCIGDKSDKTAILANFCDQDLLLELFSRDVNIGENLSEEQSQELLTSLLESSVSEEMEEDLVTYVVSNIDTNTLLEQISEDSLLETTIERCSASNILTAVARSL